MTPETYRQASELFIQFSRLPDGERSDALKAACAGDAELHEQVSRMLLADLEALGGSFMERPAIEDAAQLLVPGFPDSPREGSRLGPYEIVGLIGEGGMGQVFKAFDTRLNRVVAIKTSMCDFDDRFERECRAVAALNHPNICTLFDIGPKYLVMECIEGPTLAQKMATGAVPIREALMVARQIAEGLRAAHESGIVHRDLKPSNIKFTAEGNVKILDFGLAKTCGARPAKEPSHSPAPSPNDTVAGMILGTAAYMSPEQARGMIADRRADIWAFGVVLFEMLTGGRLFFKPESAADTLAAVLSNEPDWAALPPETPLAVRRLLRRCLERHRDKRLPDIAVARLEIDDAENDPEAPITSQPVSGGLPALMPWAITLVLAVALTAGLVWWLARLAEPERPLVRLTAETPEGLSLVRVNLGGMLAISPDGRRLALSLRAADGKMRLYIRSLDRREVSLLPDTENASSPFFSPDGQWVGFAAGGKLRKISVDGGAAVTLCEGPAIRGASWGDDGNIVVALAANTFLSRVPSWGGTPVPLTKLGPGERSHRWPQVLPGSQTVVFTSSAAFGTYDDAVVEALSTKTGIRKVVQRGGYAPRYVSSSRRGGHLLFVHEGTLFATPFDPRGLTQLGSPVPILSDLSSTSTSGADLDLTMNGSLVYMAGTRGSGGWPMQWLDSAGATQPVLPSLASYATPRVSPDGQRLAFSLASGQDSDLWVQSRVADAPFRLTFFKGLNRCPVWTPDSRNIVFGSDNSASPGLYWVRSDGSGEARRLSEGKPGQAPTSISPDGKRLAFQQLGRDGSSDIFTATLDTNPVDPRLGKPELFLGTPADETGPAFSPDARWLAYASNESGSYEIYVRAFPGPGGHWQISTGGGMFPVWSATKTELLFRDADGRMLAASYSSAEGFFAAGKPRLWTDVPVLTLPHIATYDLEPGGKRLVAILAGTEDAANPITHLTFLLNFFDELRRRSR